MKAAVGAGPSESGHPAPQHAFRTSHEPEAVRPAKFRAWQIAVTHHAAPIGVPNGVGSNY